MTLRKRNPEVEAVAQQAARMAYRIVIASMDADDNVQATASGGRVLQTEELDRVFPYGLWSNAPPNGEAIALPTECGDAVIADRVARPSALGNAGAGESALYDASGNLIWMRGSNGIEIRLIRGQMVNVTDVGGPGKTVVLDGDSVMPTTDVVAALNASGWPGTAATPIGTVTGSSTLLEAK